MYCRCFGVWCWKEIWGCKRLQCLALPHRGWSQWCFSWTGADGAFGFGSHRSTPSTREHGGFGGISVVWAGGGFIHQDQSNASKKAIAAMSEDGGDMLHGTLSSHLHVVTVVCSRSCCKAFMVSRWRFWALHHLHAHIFAANSPNNHIIGWVQLSGHLFIFIPNVNINMEE